MKQTTPINQAIIHRVQLLTHEIDKLANILISKGQEVELLFMQNQKLTHTNNQSQLEVQRSKTEFYNLAEELKNRTIEHEELISQHHRLKSIHMKEIQTELADLQKLNDSLIKTVQVQESDLVVAKEQFIIKTTELQHANQQVYHFENSMKLVKDEKLKYIVEYQAKEKENQALLTKLKEMGDFQVMYKNSLVDMELVRANYSSLFTQKEHDRQKLNEQLNVQRDLSKNNIEYVELKYVDMINKGNEQLKEEYEAKIKSIVLQLENHVSTLTNLLDAKSQDSDRMQLQLENNVMRMRQEFTKDIQSRNQTITELNNNNYKLQQLLQQMNKEIYGFEESAGKGQVLNKQELFSLQNTISQLTEQIHAYEARCQELQRQNDKIQVQMKEKNLFIQPDNNTIKKSPKRLENFDVESEDKINYLLRVISNKNTQLEQRENIMSQMNKLSIPNA